MYIAAAKGSSHTCDQKGEKVSPLILLTWRCLTGRVVLLCPMSRVCRPFRYIPLHSVTLGCCTRSSSAPEGVPGSAMTPLSAAGYRQTTSTNLCFSSHS